jgi:hypothetical protein
MPVQLQNASTVAGGILAHRRLICCGLAAALVLVPNAVAYLHARAMTTFTVGGARSARPEELSSFEKARILMTGVNLPRPLNEQTPDVLGLTYETCLVRGDDGIDLETWVIPCAEPRACVLMFHGYSASKASLLPEALALHEQRCELLLIDFRGSGGSSGNETTLGVYEADDVRRRREGHSNRTQDAEITK